MGEILVVVLAVVTAGGRVLIGRRADGVPPWVFPGGKLERGETAASAVARELLEETGAWVVAEKELGRRVHPVTAAEVIYVACSLERGSPEPTVVAPLELAEVRWASAAEALELMPTMADEVKSHLQRRVRESLSEQGTLLAQHSEMLAEILRRLPDPGNSQESA